MHSKIPGKTQNQTCIANQQSIIKLDPTMEQETVPYTGSSVSQHV